MGSRARDRAHRAHGAGAVAVAIRAGAPARRRDRALQGTPLLPSLHEHHPAVARPDPDHPALLIAARTALEAPLERGELRAYRAPHGDLRVGRREAFGALALGHRFLRGLEGLLEREGVAQCLVVERFAEP